MLGVRAVLVVDNKLAVVDKDGTLTYVPYDFDGESIVSYNYETAVGIVSVTCVTDSRVHVMIIHEDLTTTYHVLDDVKPEHYKPFTIHQVGGSCIFLKDRIIFIGLGKDHHECRDIPYSYEKPDVKFSYKIYSPHNCMIDAYIVTSDGKCRSFNRCTFNSERMIDEVLRDADVTDLIDDIALKVSGHIRYSDYPMFYLVNTINMLFIGRINKETGRLDKKLIGTQVDNFFEVDMDTLIVKRQDRVYYYHCKTRGVKTILKNSSSVIFPLRSSYDEQLSLISHRSSN